MTKKLTLSTQDNTTIDLYTSIPAKKIKGEFGKDNFSVDGVPIKITEKKLNDLKSGKLALDVTITYPKKYHQLTFVKSGLTLHESTLNDLPKITTLTSDETPVLLGPVLTEKGGRNIAYVLMGRKWKQDPKIVMSLKDDALLAATGMNKANVLHEATEATKTWDHATNQNLFSDNGAVLTTTANWKYDGVNNMAFTPYATGCTALAATGVWYKTQGIPVGQMYLLVESDMTFNSNLKWSATKESGKLDFQSVILHELGHTIGLGDLYNKTAFKTDTVQVMHYYTGIKRTLGNGDATGVWTLYG